MSEAPDVSVVTVTWNSENEIYECLTSASASLKGLSGEFIVIDNNSSDNTEDEVRRAAESGIHNIHLILNNENKGYAAACNQGIAVSGGKHILLLNPDTVMHGKCIAGLRDKLESDQRLGAVAPQLLNSDGSIQYSCRRFPGYRDIFFELLLLSSIFPRSRFFSRWKMKYFQHNEESIVDQPMAAALMVRGSLLRELNGFDIQFGMFFNDVDLCRRIYDRGLKIAFVPEFKSEHQLGASVRKNKPAMIDAWNRDCRRYFSKYFDNPLSFSVMSAGLTVSGAIRKLFYRT